MNSDNFTVISVFKKKRKWQFGGPSFSFWSWSFVLWSQKKNIINYLSLYDCPNSYKIMLLWNSGIWQGYPITVIIWYDIVISFKISRKHTQNIKEKVQKSSEMNRNMKKKNKSKPNTLGSMPAITLKVVLFKMVMPQYKLSIKCLHKEGHKISQRYIKEGLN